MISVTERRQAFRVNCQAIVELKQVDKTTVEQSDAAALFSEDTEFSLLSEFQRLDRECVQVARSLNKVDSNLLDYLKLTQAKIDQLSRIVLANLPGMQAIPAQIVSLSEAGINFCGSRLFYQDSLLALRLVFLPHYQSVILFAKVLRCEPTDTGTSTTKGSDSKQSQHDSYRIAAEFLPLMETSRRLIAQQVLRAQREAKLKLGSKAK